MRPATLPSPPSGTLDLGPVSLNMYGVMIAVGIVAAVALAGRRLERAGAGTRDDFSSIATWAVVGGLIGARLYHVVTDWSSFADNLGRIPQIWRGGLGIPGGLAGGFAAGLVAGRRRNVPLPQLLSAAAPAIPLAQAIGRWGNWWNQELFGGPTSLPWALEVDAHKVPRQYAPETTFHPTFLYESLWNLALCGALLLVDRRITLRPGRLMAVYLSGYFAGRFWIEGLRIDRAHVIGGLRLNQWVALGVVTAATAFLVVDAVLHRRVSAPAHDERSSEVVTTDG